MADSLAQSEEKIVIDLGLRYSFGGTRKSPLIHGRIPAFYIVDESHDSLQAALLERTDNLLTELANIFDGALSTFDDETKEKSQRLLALEKMYATVIYTTGTVLTQSPSVKYAIMFTRIQQIFARMPTIASVFSQSVAKTVRDSLEAPWNVLRAIDASFRHESSEEGPV